MLQAETRAAAADGAGGTARQAALTAAAAVALPEGTAQTARAADRSAIRAATSRAYIKARLPEIEAWAQDCLRAAGCSYTARAQYGVCAIPAKSYDNIYFPAGNYEALTITLGAGEGANWWCVVFPTLCTAATSDEAELQAAAGGFDEDEAAWITEEQPEYRLRFKTLEWLQKLKELFS